MMELLRRTRKKRIQRILEAPIWEIRKLLLGIYLSLLLCGFLYIKVIGEDASALFSILLIVPLAFNGTILYDRYRKSTREAVKMGLYFDASVVIVFLLIIAAACAYMTDRSWYIYILITAFAINFIQVGVTDRKVEKEFAQRILENPLKAMQKSLFYAFGGNILCIILFFRDIGSRDQIVGAIAFGVPIAAYLGVLEYQYKKVLRDAIEIGIEFKISSIVAAILLVVSLGGYSFNQKWYFYILVIVLVINLLQLYQVLRQRFGRKVS